MTPKTENIEERNPRRNRKRWVFAGLFLVMASVLTWGGITVWKTLTVSAPSAPPEVKGDLLEPAVVSAIEVIRDRVLKEPRSAQAWGDLGQVFLANDLEEEGSICFAEAERLDPANPRWPYYQAGRLLNQGDREGAVTLLTRAVERYATEGEDSAAPRLRLAETLLFLGRLEEAETHIRLVSNRLPDDAHVQFDMGLLAMAREDWKTAQEYLLRCLASPFAQQRARIQLVIVCSQRGDAPNADEFRAQLDGLPPDPDWSDPFITEYLHWAVKKKNRYRLAEQLEAAGHFSEAAVVLKPLAAEFPDDYLPQLTLGKVLAQSGDFRGAEEYLRRAIRLAPDKVQPHHYLSLLLLKKGEKELGVGDTGGKRAKTLGVGDTGGERAKALFQESASLARGAIQIKPDYGLAQMSLGLSLKHLGKRTEALAALRQAVRCNPEFAELHYHLGELLVEEGLREEARPRLEQAIRIAPPGAPWRQAAETRLAELRKDAKKDKTPN